MFNIFKAFNFSDDGCLLHLIFSKITFNQGCESHPKDFHALVIFYGIKVQYYIKLFMQKSNAYISHWPQFIYLFILTVV